MTYVTDTHALVFFASGDAARMSRKCLRIFRRAEQQRDRVHVPIMCFFELALLLERGRVKSALRFEEWHDRIAHFRDCRSSRCFGQTSAQPAAWPRWLTLSTG